MGFLQSEVWHEKHTPDATALYVQRGTVVIWTRESSFPYFAPRVLAPESNEARRQSYRNR